MFRIEYVGTSPYINCQPSLYHHRLGPKDQFLILSSDGLYQYFTNEEAVAEVELFILLSPEGDPAQHLVEEVLFRAAKKAGKFTDLLLPRNVHLRPKTLSWDQTKNFDLIVFLIVQVWISMSC